MGLTRTHLWGVFITETLLGAAGAALALTAFITSSGRSTQLLLAVVCAFLAQIGVLLSSILSLLFLLGARVDAAATEALRGHSHAVATQEDVGSVANAEQGAEPDEPRAGTAARSQVSPRVLRTRGVSG